MSEPFDFEHHFYYKTLKIASEARDCKDDLVMPPLNVYYAIFHVFKRYSQQLVIYLLQFSLWFSLILSSDSGKVIYYVDKYVFNLFLI